MSKKLIILVTLFSFSCAASPKKQEVASAPPAPSKESTTLDPVEDSFAQYGPLEVGLDYKAFKKVSIEPFISPTHGRRFVEIYVNALGYEAYIHGKELPVGTILIKNSWEREGENPLGPAGPIFVMEKRAAGFAPDKKDWWYAIHWDKPIGKWEKRFGGPIYWRSPSPKVNYCSSCHEDYDHQVGLPPKEKRNWPQMASDPSE